MFDLDRSYTILGGKTFTGADVIFNKKEDTCLHCKKITKSFMIPDLSFPTNVTTFCALCRSIKEKPHHFKGTADHFTPVLIETIDGELLLLEDKYSQKPITKVWWNDTGVELRYYGRRETSNAIETYWEDPTNLTERRIKFLKGSFCER